MELGDRTGLGHAEESEGTHTFFLLFVRMPGNVEGIEGQDRCNPWKRGQSTAPPGTA